MSCGNHSRPEHCFILHTIKMGNVCCSCRGGHRNIIYETHKTGTCTWRCSVDQGFFNHHYIWHCKCQCGTYQMNKEIHTNSECIWILLKQQRHRFIWQRTCYCNGKYASSPIHSRGSSSLGNCIWHSKWWANMVY